MNVVTRELALRRAVPFIAEFEGGQSPDGKFRAYRDPVGVLTIGFGETQGVREGMVWSKAKAYRRLRKRLRRDFLPPLERAIPKSRHPRANQVAAFLSFVYNLGVGMVQPSHTFGRYLQKGDLHDAVMSMLMYDMAGGHRLPGLTRRRRAEVALAQRKAR